MSGQELQRKSFTVCLTAALVAVAMLACLSKTDAHASPVVGFDPSNIIDDSVFTNSRTMTVAQIQEFLNSKVPICDTWGTRGTTSTSRADYLRSMGDSVPLKCLRDYVQDGKSSAQIIYDTAQKYQINPQVLIVLLQKEQALVTDDWPGTWQFRSATGYACADTSACDSKYYGLTNQLDWAGKMFRAIINNSPTWYTPYVLGYNERVYFNPGPCTKKDDNDRCIQRDPGACGSTPLNIQNRATQALYNYTPYQPNASALAAGYGEGDSCGAYGNRNFYLYFTDWFGSTKGFPVLSEVKGRYDRLGGTNGVLGIPAAAGFCNNARTACWQQFKNGYIVYSPSSGSWESKGSIREYWGKIGFQNGKLGYPVDGEVYAGNGLWWQQFQNGFIIGTSKTGFWESMGKIRERWGKLGYQSSTIGLPIDKEVTNADGSGWQQFQNGFMIIPNGVNADVWESKGAIRTFWQSIGFQGGKAGWPAGSEVYDINTKTWSQGYQKGTIYYSDIKGGWFVASESVN